LTVKIIAISDLHQGNPISPPSNIEVVSQDKLILNLAKRNPDGILIAGDLQDYMWNLGTETSRIPLIKKQLRNDPVFNSLNKIGKTIPVIFVWGNTDIMDFEKGQDSTPVTDEMRKWFCNEFSNLKNCHSKICYIKEIAILGYNDANKTTDEHSGKCWDEPAILEDLKPALNNFTDDNILQKGIFLTHTPPRGVLDFSSLGDRHIGSFHFREIIEDIQPILSIFGHVHYCGGYSEYIGKTQCINVSSFGLAISYDILFGQSAFELQIDPDYTISSTKMIVSHFWEKNYKKAFLEYRSCQICGRHTPFARKEFKTCRVCLGAKRIEKKQQLAS
jgi:Icc-related predicted phosphoesterase/ribosomal protein S14